MAIRVAGKVVVRETGGGIADLRVDVVLVSAAGSTRLGSTTTDIAGVFRFGTEPAAGGRERARPEPDDPTLQLRILPPSRAGDPEPSPIAEVRREDAAGFEAFIIEVPAGIIEEAGLGSAEIAGRDARRAAEEAERESEASEAFRGERMDRLRTALRQRRTLRAAVEEHFPAFLSALSGVPEEVRRSARYVGPGRSVREANIEVMKAGLAGRINGTEVIGAAALDDDLLDGLGLGPDGLVPDDKRELLERTIRPNAATLLRLLYDPAELCKKLAPTREGCLSKLDEPEPEPVEDDVPPAAEPAPADIPAMIEALTADLAGEGGGIAGRATLEQIQKIVDEFSLRSGPADVAAVHEFKSLKIAFEPVWAELLDSKVVGAGRRAYEQLVELGEDPNEYLIESGEFEGFSDAPAESSVPDPPSNVLQVFEVEPDAWAALSHWKRSALGTLASEYMKIRYLPITKEVSANLGFATVTVTVPLTDDEMRERDRQLRSLRAQGMSILSWGAKTGASGDLLDRYSNTLQELAAGLKEAYRFSIYAADRRERSINFGIIANYRQVWEPEAYQAGKLVKTVPLAPKESRRYSKKVTLNRTRSRKETEDRLSSRAIERQETTRAEAEIIARTAAKTNFSANAAGSFDIGIAGASASQSFGKENEAESQETKRQFREAVSKAAEEYRLEHSVEVTTGETEDISAEESGEISNPNDEITVTYLFYQLERRYRISEQLQSVTPVVLVAQEVPEPGEIDEAWILSHDWILRRVILDQSFVPALDYIATGMVGDEAALREKRVTLQQQRALVADLKDELVTLQHQARRRYAALESSISARASIVDEDDNDGVLEDFWESTWGESGESAAGAQIREDAARDAYQRAAKHERELLERIASETATISEMTQRYADALSEHLNRRAQINRLRVHLKSNILYYVQAIWSFEPPDQRFFRLHEIPVPRIEGKKTYKVVDDPDSVPMPPDWQKPKKLTMKCQLSLREMETDPLEAVADLDNLLGFKGNYMIFPLRSGNDLTDMMTLPYVDPVLGLRDPDPTGGWTPSQFAGYVCCLHARLGEAKFAPMRQKLAAAYQQILESGSREGELVVPTGSLFIEALPGSHPVLEDFKLLHRVTDVRGAIAAVRSAELENVRMAARVLAGEREDPQIERKVVIEGAPGSVDVDPDDA